jgi:GNAT superfamily N-acetyltransferase
MSESISVVPAGAVDLPAMSALISSLFAVEPDFSINEARQIAGLRMQLDDPARSVVLKAVDEGKLVGMLTVQLVASTAQGTWSALMEDVVVAPSHRGRGVGKALVKEAEAWAVSKGATRMQLLVDNKNTPAITFYDQQGYEATRMICRRKYLS